MKQTKLVVLSLCALVFGRAPGFCTANTEGNSPLELLCKGAGVNIDDVRWRVAAGLDQEQAVEAALAQKKFDESAKKAAKK